MFFFRSFILFHSQFIGLCENIRNRHFSVGGDFAITRVQRIETTEVNIFGHPGSHLKKKITIKKKDRIQSGTQSQMRCERV